MASSRPDPFFAFKDLSHDKNLNPMRQDLLALMDDTSTSPDVHLRILLQAPQLESVLLGNEEYTTKPVKRIGSPPRLPTSDDSKSILRALLASPISIPEAEMPSWHLYFCMINIQKCRREKRVVRRGEGWISVRRNNGMVTTVLNSFGEEVSSIKSSFRLIEDKNVLAMVLLRELLKSWGVRTSLTL